MGTQGKETSGDLGSKITRRKFIQGSLSVGGVLLAAACTPAVAPEPTKPPAGMTPAPIATPTIIKSGPVQIRYYDSKLTDATEGPVVESILKAFEAKNPGITVKREGVAFADTVSKLLVIVQGGDAPDVCRMGGESIYPFYAMGALTPLNDLTRKFKAEELFNYPDATRKGLQFGGNDYFLAITANLFPLTRNADLYTKAGLDPAKPPQSWPDLVDHLKKMTIKAENQYGWGMIADKTASTSRRIFQWLISAGAEVFSPDGKQVVINSQAGVDGMTFWSDLALKHEVVPPGSVNATFTDVLTGYSQRKIAMWTGMPNNIMSSETKSPGIGKVTRLDPFPAPWRPPLWVNGFIMTKSKYPDESFQLMSYLSSVEAMETFIKGTYNTPVRPAVAASPVVQAVPFVSQASSFFKNAVYNPSVHPQFAKIEALVLDAVQAVLTKAKTPKKALDDVATEGNKILASS